MIVNDNDNLYYDAKDILTSFGQHYANNPQNPKKHEGPED